MPPSSEVNTSAMPEPEWEIPTRDTPSRVGKITPLVGCFVAGLLVGGIAVGAITGAVGNNDSAENATTYTEEQGSKADDTKKVEVPQGQPINAPTMKILVEEVTYTDDLMLTQPDEHKYPREGAVFALVKAKVENLSPDKGWDLTCHYTGDFIPTAAFSDKGNKYLPTDDLHRIQGNPECNENTPAGFEVDMTWVFEIPRVDVIDYVGFNDPSDSETENPVGYYTDIPE